jgi:hypothetical protein
MVSRTEQRKQMGSESSCTPFPATGGGSHCGSGESNCQSHRYARG